MAGMVTRAPSDRVRSGELTGTTNGSAPSSWGLGDGAAIPWEYAPAPESADVVTLKEVYGLFIGGREVPSSDGETFVSVNPPTSEVDPSASSAVQPVGASGRSGRSLW